MTYGLIPTPENSPRVLERVMRMMTSALEKIPQERERMGDTPVREWDYRNGVLDGMEETLTAIFDVMTQTDSSEETPEKGSFRIPEGGGIEIFNGQTWERVGSMEGQG